MGIRISSGTASYLGLQKGEVMEKPSTAYIMVPGEKCRGGCFYCPQGEGKSGWLSRVSWPLFNLNEFNKAVEKSDLQRICLQSPDVKNFEEKIIKIIDGLKYLGKPISLSSPPVSNKTLRKIKGPVDRIGVGIDGVTNDIRDKTKPKYNPLLFWDYLGRAVKIYGENNVTAHIMVGLGENLDELAATIKRTYTAGAKTSLFPLQYKDEEIDISYYRKAQLITYLIENDYSLFESIDIIVNNPKKCVEFIEDGEIFMTQGCPGCNRPFYTSRPGKEHKNFPRKPTIEEIQLIKKELNII